MGSCSNSNEVYIGVKNGNARKTRSVCRVVAEERWSRDAIQRVLATPSELRPVDDNEVGADDIESSEKPHDYSARDADAPEPATADAPDDVDAEVFKRIRITKADCIKYGYTGGCPRCADLEFWKANSKRHTMRNAELACIEGLSRRRMRSGFESKPNIDETVPPSLNPSLPQWTSMQLMSRSYRHRRSRVALNNLMMRIWLITMTPIQNFQA